MRAHLSVLLVGTLLVGAGVVTVAGCGGPQPSKELLDARTAYERARKNATAQAPASVDDAKKAKDAAERSSDDDAESEDTKTLARIASLKAELAEATARQVLAQKEREKSEKEYVALTGEQLRTARKELSSTKHNLERTQEQLAEAEKKAAQAMADLQRIAAVKQESRGMVITLSGSVLFQSNEATLLPAAMLKLNDVADALIKGNPDSNITVEGHTDSQGQRQYNMDLSRKRADSVRDQLVSRGVAADRIKSVGIGPDRPIADNKSAEGRANNRRVEIIVEPPKK